jgi:thiol peroxidase
MDKQIGAVKFKGKPVDLIGRKIQVGEKAPDFSTVSQTLEVVSLSATPCKPRLFSVVPSLDTAVCSAQTKQFDEELAALGHKVAAYTVSLDLPFAQKRFCTTENVRNMQTLSDARDHSFGRNWGVLIDGLPLPLLARSVFVVDDKGTVVYAEIVHEVTEHPNYEAALAALQAITG